MSSARGEVRAALERLVILTREGDGKGAEAIVNGVASALMRDVSQGNARFLLPLLMDVWFYLRQNRCDLAVEYALRARDGFASAAG